MAFKIKNAHSFLLHHHLITTIITIIIIFHKPQTTTATLITPQQSLTNTTTINSLGGSGSGRGHWIQLQKSIGISAMHMQVMKDNKVVIFDRTDFGPSNISLANNRCRYDPRDMALKIDCTAHSILYDLTTDTFRPLTLQTDAWCSSGAVNPNGTLIQTGGFNDGYTKLRTFTPCPKNNDCDWEELPQNLSSSRWYASNQILPDGRIIVVGGRSSFSYEFVPKNANDPSFYFFRFLQITRDSNPGEENNLYPFLHLLPDGNLFIFANRRSILFDYNHNRVIREFPIIPGEEKRNYPSTGSSVMLPLNLTGSKTGLIEVEIMVCGGAYPGAFDYAKKEQVFLEASDSCGRLKVTDSEPEWVMEFMPTPRVMPDMLLLPTGDVIILNGAANGTAGWENAANPVLHPVLYRPGLVNPVLKFELLAPASTPRMYHSSAVLLPDGRILVGGSNPHRGYDFRAYPYPTELSLDIYNPDYLGPEMDQYRPSVDTVEVVNHTVEYGSLFSVVFSLKEKRDINGIRFSMVAPSFTTHSFAMNQRILFLEVTALEEVVNSRPESPQGPVKSVYKAMVRGPGSFTVAPPGYYMLYVVHAGVPSVAKWVHIR
ncbi:unnamed protein product [Vicia faba]|uniref:Galactose oxidase n=1 Tax=Vicia faba TaxID=3906 RepID=A0AAV0YUY0_VICFA|nr:unnamed protein product [Vicia faba]